METDSDIYENIPNTDDNDLYEEIEKLQQQNNLLQELINSLEGDIEKLCGKITEMKKIQDNLSKNISELFKTAKAELERKDRIIAELRTQLDGFLQRKKSNFSMKRERDKSPSVGKLPPEHVAKKMRHEEDNRMKHGHFKRSRSRSRSSERSRRLYKERRDRFDRHKHDYDNSRRITTRDEKYTERGYRSKNYLTRDHDRKEITKRDMTEVKSSTGMDRRGIEEKRKVEEMAKKKKDLDKREVIIIIDRAENTELKNSLENESTKIEVNKRAKLGKEGIQKEAAKIKNVESVDKMEGQKENHDEWKIEVEKNETAAQEKEMNKKCDSVNEDLKEVTEELNGVGNATKRKRALDQKKIAVKRNVRGIIVKSHVVTMPTICNQEGSSMPTCPARSTDDENEKNKTPLNKQNEENLTRKEKSGVKVNTTIIVETANKLKERLQEELKQDPQKATPLTLQFADFAKVTIDNAEVSKTKIGEVTRKLFEDSEDEGRHKPQEATPTGLNTADVAESSKKNVAKAGIKIEALSKKLLGRLEEAKHDPKKTKGVADQKDGPLKTKDEVFMELFGCIEDEEEAEQKVIPVKKVANEDTDGDKNKTEEVAQKSVDQETDQILQRDSKFKSKDDIIKTTVEEVSKKLFPGVGEDENQKSISASSVVANSEEIANKDGKDEDKSQKGGSDEETKKVLRKSSPGSIKLDSFSEGDYKNEDEINQMRIEEVSKNLFRKIVEEAEDDKQKGTSVGSISATEVASKNGEKDVVDKGEEVKISKTEDLGVNLAESIRSSIDFTKKRHDMMYGEVSKEISMFVPQCGIQSKNTEANQNNNKPFGTIEKIEDKGKVNDKHKEKKEDNTVKNDIKKNNKEQKSQKIDRGKKKNESSKLTQDGETVGELNDQKIDKEKKNVSSKQNEGGQNTNKDEKTDKVRKRSESSKLSKIEKIREGHPEALNEQKLDKEKKNERKNTNKDENFEIASKHQRMDKGKKKSESSKATQDDGKIREALNHQKVEKEKKTSVESKDNKTKKEENSEVAPKHQSTDKGKKKSESSKSTQGNEKIGEVDKETKTSIQNGEENSEIASKHQKEDGSSKHNKEKKSEVSSKNEKAEAERSESPKKSSPKEIKSKKPKESTKKDAKNKDDDSSGSFKEESDRVLRSATRRSSRLQEETQKKNTKIDLSPCVEASVNLSHDGEIPVLHILEDSHLARNLESCPSMVTSSPIKSDSNVSSFNLSGLNGSNSFGESRVFNTSSGKKRRRVILTMVD